MYLNLENHQLVDSYYSTLSSSIGVQLISWLHCLYANSADGHFLLSFLFVSMDVCYRLAGQLQPGYAHTIQHTASTTHSAHNTPNTPHNIHNAYTTQHTPHTAHNTHHTHFFVVVWSVQARIILTKTNIKQLFMYRVIIFKVNVFIFFIDTPSCFGIFLAILVSFGHF